MVKIEIARDDRLPVKLVNAISGASRGKNIRRFNSSYSIAYLFNYFIMLFVCDLS